ncbi:hypothetical protein [Micromonospora aurantiaca (nom. illeg.)]|uniref:hypothetical protein n=1 Tax=Micromonospora aurantiaca (nom. illeg.) TaxID=47850 RepID=UPI00340DD768
MTGQIHRLSELDLGALAAVAVGRVRVDSRFPGKHLVTLPTRPARREKLAPWAMPRLLRLQLASPGPARRQAPVREGQGLPYTIAAYRLTAEGEHLVRSLNDEVPRCRICGCTEDRACPGGCFWVPDPQMGDLCSACPVDLDQAGAR